MDQSTETLVSLALAWAFSGDREFKRTAARFGVQAPTELDLLRMETPPTRPIISRPAKKGGLFLPPSKSQWGPPQQGLGPSAPAPLPPPPLTLQCVAPEIKHYQPTMTKEQLGQLQHLLGVGSTTTTLKATKPKPNPPDLLFPYSGLTAKP